METENSYLTRLTGLGLSLGSATLAVLVLTWIFIASQPPQVRAQGSAVVQTEWGPVNGFLSGETYAFLGIPYAAPPVGDLRWQPPVDPTPWIEPLETLSFGPACPQWDNNDEVVIGEEDCLSLNVWTPLTGTPGADLPVMVFIHGGGNVQGSASQETGGFHLYAGRNLSARGDVVVVTLQYRLGALGYMVHPGLDAESAHGGSGNYGLLDQLKALQWVQNNISNFGGDPGRVLLFGESGGAVDTCMLLTSPLATGLFSRALMQSGGCIARPAAERSLEGLAFAEAAGCGTAPYPILCLRDATTHTLVTAVDTTPISDGIVNGSFGPNIDGYVIPQSPLNALALGEHNPVPFTVGSNADEMLPLVPDLSETLYALLVHALLDPFRPGAGDEALALYPVGVGPGEYPTAREAYAALLSDAQFTCPARQVARLAASSGDPPAYRSFFSQVLSSTLYAPLGAFHGLELFFVFQQLDDYQWYLPKPEDLALEQAILGYWTRFAATGNPNGGSTASWPVYIPESDPYLELGTPIAGGEGLRREKCDLWDDILLPSFALRGLATPAAVHPGDLLTYTFKLVNTGGNAGGVVISDSLDSHTTLVWASDDGIVDGDTLVWDVGTLSATQRITRSWVVRVDDVPGDGLLLNTVYVTSAEGSAAIETIETPVSELRWKGYLPLVNK